jgi:lipoprotein-releasing system permease protein
VYAGEGANLEKIKSIIREVGGSTIEVRDRFQQNQALFSAMKTEKLIIYAISFLILVIAGFNIISSLTMTVIEKQKDIAVLKAMGASDNMVYRIFMQLGVLLAGIGAATGFAIGILICIGQQQFHWVKLGGQSFIINYYPVSVRLSDLLVVASITIIIALVAAWIPSKRANESAYSLR